MTGRLSLLLEHEGGGLGRALFFFLVEARLGQMVDGMGSGLGWGRYSGWGREVIGTGWEVVGMGWD